MKTVPVKNDYARILKWLIDNIGPVLHSQPLIFWHGEGWHMGRISARAVDINRPTDYYYTVRIDDDEKAVWFALLWG